MLRLFNRFGGGFILLLGRFIGLILWGRVGFGLFFNLSLLNVLCAGAFFFNHRICRVGLRRGGSGFGFAVIDLQGGVGIGVRPLRPDLHHAPGDRPVV